MQIEEKLQAPGLQLPAPTQAPPGLRLPFAWVRQRGNRAYVSGHGPLNLDGSIAGPFGKVGAHARSAVGLAELPFGWPVEIEAEVEVAE